MAKRNFLVQQPLEPESDLMRVLLGQHGLPSVLIAASYVERGLATLLHRHFVEGSTADSLLEPNGAIGSLAVRAKTAYSLGLIDKLTRQNAVQIGEIRNEFAHSDVSIGFDEKRVEELCKMLTYPPTLKIIGRSDEVLSADDETLDPEDRFTLIAVFTCRVLNHFIEQVERRTATSHTWTMEVQEHRS